MKRPARLIAGREWVARMKPLKNIVKSYAKWFGVDLVCAVDELRMLGEDISEEYRNTALQVAETKAIGRKMRREKEAGLTEEHVYFWEEHDYTTGYIYGFIPIDDESTEEETEDRPADDDLPF